MTNKRLDYDPLKAVLQYLEPNLRIQIALRIPSIRTTEKVAPMKIEHLTSKHNKIIINDTTYRVGIYRQYHHPAQTPLLHQKQDGGFGYNIEQWGFRTDPDEDPVTDGDIDLREKFITWKDGTPLMEEVYIDALVHHEEALRRLAERDGLELDPIMPELQDLRNPEFIVEQNERRIQRMLGRPFDELRKWARFYQCQLLPYYYRRNNIFPPFTSLIQLTIEGPNGKVIERVAHSKRLCEAMKYLNTMFFGGRRRTIQVKEVAFVENSYTHRFPNDMRIKIRQMQSAAVRFEKLEGLIVPSSYPLEVLYVECGTSDSATFEQMNVKTARKLIISNVFFESDSYIPLLRKLENECIILRYQSESRRETQHFMDLFENWLGSERAKGTNLTIGFREENSVMELLELIKSRFEIIEQSVRSITLSMRNGSKLLVSCEKFDQEEIPSRNSAEFWDRHIKEEKHSKWALKLVVV